MDETIKTWRRPVTCRYFILTLHSYKLYPAFCLADMQLSARG